MHKSDQIFSFRQFQQAFFFALNKILQSEVVKTDTLVLLSLHIILLLLGLYADKQSNEANDACCILTLTSLLIHSSGVFE